MSTVVEKRLKEFCSNMEYLFFYTDKYFFWQELLLKAKSEKKNKIWKRNRW